MKKKLFIVLISVFSLFVFLLVVCRIMKPIFDKMPIKHMQEISDIFSEFEPLADFSFEDSQSYVYKYELTFDEWNSILPKLKKFKAISSETVCGITYAIEDLFTQEEIDSVKGGYKELYSLPGFMTNYYCETVIGEIQTENGVLISVYSFIGGYKTFTLF